MFEHPPPEVFFVIAKKTAARSAAIFLHSCSDNSSATFLKILGPGHQSSGHQVRSSDPTSENFTIVSRPQWLRERFESFRIWYTTKYLQLVYLGFFYIGDLRSGQFRDLPIISQWGKVQMPQMLIRGQFHHKINRQLRLFFG